MIDHQGCIMTIVGSRHFLGFAWRAQAEKIIREALATHRPILVISGGAPNIDDMANRLADSAGIATLIVRPTVFTWSAAGGLKDRNTKMAEGCQCLVRIGSRSSTTYGSGWTADLAERLGKNVYRHMLGEDPPAPMIAGSDFQPARLPEETTL